MKLTLILSLIFSFSAFSASISSTKSKINVARIAKVYNFGDKGIIVNVTVEDLGGSTDVSPTQKVYFTLYQKGEIFSTDASFYLGAVVEVKSARRLTNESFEVTVLNANLKTQKMVINAYQAIYDMFNVRCSEEERECTQALNFKTKIDVSRK